MLAILDETLYQTLIDVNSLCHAAGGRREVQTGAIAIDSGVGGGVGEVSFGPEAVDGSCCGEAAPASDAEAQAAFEYRRESQIGSSFGVAQLDSGAFSQPCYVGRQRGCAHLRSFASHC